VVTNLVKTGTHEEPVYCTVQYSTVQYNKVHYSTVPYSTIPLLPKNVFYVMRTSCRVVEINRMAGNSIWKEIDRIFSLYCNSIFCVSYIRFYHYIYN
jgi:hypothetical protein